MKKAYTFDDVALVPQYNNVQSRTEPDLSTHLTRRTKVGMPLIPANMDTVIGPELADILIEHNSCPIVHRFMTFEKKLDWVKNFGVNLYVSSGVKNEDLEEIFRLHEETQGSDTFRGVCFDIAHGHSKVMLMAIERFKKMLPNKEVIAGNVCTAMAYQDLVNAGADAVKVGIGPGAACTTRVVTGFGVPQFTAIQDCYEIARRLRAPLIADGGIRNSRDVALALAAGASSVMIGKLFAMTYESASQKQHIKLPDGTTRCVSAYRGQASEAFQKDFYGKLKQGTVPEGVSMETEITKSAEDVISELLGGVRSAMTYGGARTISEFQQKAEFVEVTHSYMTESKPRV